MTFPVATKCVVSLAAWKGITAPVRSRHMQKLFIIILKVSGNNKPKWA